MRLGSRAGLFSLAAASATAMYASLIRPRMLSWGATQAETIRTYPSDQLVPEPEGGATMATTLPASPEKVWPWLIQMGRGRGGWYSWDWVDNKGEPSADRIEPRWQKLEEGQRLQGPTNWWTVRILEPGRTLVLHSSYSLSGHSFDPHTDRVPWAYIDGIWGFHMREASGGRTRLVVRTRGRSHHPHLLTKPFTRLVGEPVHFIMQTRQFHNLRTRASSVTSPAS